MGRRRQPAPTRRPRPSLAAPTRVHVLRWVVPAILVLLAALADDRHAGLIADGRQMIRTAVALAETGEIGQARGRDFVIETPAGDPVSRFGLAMSLLQVPAAWLAPWAEAEAGPGGSQALFLVVPWLATGLAAAFAGLLARTLGGSSVQIAAAALLASIASPLGSYAFLEFSEPVQAAALAGALWASVTAARTSAGHPRLELFAGFAAGMAVLAKSSLIAAAPFVLLPLVDPSSLQRTRARLVRAGVGVSGPLVLWAAFEWIRFGQFFGGYPDDRFTHPWVEGVWRLLVGPNRGFLLFYPAMVLFVWAIVRWTGGWRAAEARGWLGALLAFVVQVAVAAGYWGWHGMEGWGPRLILSAVPLLAAYAAVAPVRPAVLATFVAAGIVVNAPPLLQHPTPVATYVMNLRWPGVAEQDRWRYPFYATAESEANRTTVIPFEVLEKEPAANPWRLYWWFWRASREEGQALTAVLQRPPWVDVRPDLVPAARWPPEVARRVAPAPRLGFLGRSLTGTGGPYATAYLDALLDQVVRANQRGQIARALALSEKRLRLSPDGEAAAWRLETLRRADRATEAEALLRSLPAGTRQHPLINAALALFDRDFGEEQRARALLGSVADDFAGTPLETALRQPLSAWPSTLDELTGAPRRDAIVAR